MQFRSSALVLLALAAPASAFMGGKAAFSRNSVSVQSEPAPAEAVGATEAALTATTEKLVCYFMCVLLMFAPIDL
jgi:hypothetical protein